ncbi:hypothetical protein BTHE68_28050 [Burkholderia sp. THE68]|nr:hypothetical protein BTHE68_28050 [Burkholderia sp. THE68]
MQQIAQRIDAAMQIADHEIAAALVGGMPADDRIGRTIHASMIALLNDTV